MRKLERHSCHACVRSARNRCIGARNQIPRQGITEDAYGEIYQYFLGNFPQKEAQKGGEFFTPTSLLKLIVEVIELDFGMILEPACDVEEHQPNQRIEELLALFKG